MGKTKPAINCNLVINGTPSVWPLEVVIEEEDYYAVLDQQHRIKLDKAMVQKPTQGLATWNYTGVIYVNTPAKDSAVK